MLYDIKMHLPQLMDKMMIEDYRAGDITKLENDKTLMLKLLSGYDGFTSKIKLIDDEHKKRKQIVIDRIEIAEKNRVGLLGELDSIERDYWETVIGEITRTIHSISKPDEYEAELEEE